MTITLQDVVDYWFDKPNDYQKWFLSGTSLDLLIRSKFTSLHTQVVNGEVQPTNLVEMLGKIIILDQFSRHMYRDTSNAFASDTLALETSLTLLKDPTFRHLTTMEQIFALMPLQHSESITDKQTILDYVNLQITTSIEPDRKSWQLFIDHTEGHCQVLKQFGRYPKRNIALGRESTLEELEYIQNTGTSQY